jgi:ABC-type multidrug transport system fused ATPase/permease subunit
MIPFIRKLLAFLDTRSRVHIMLLFVPMGVVAVMEMASIAMIIPVFSALFDNGEKQGIGRYIHDIMPADMADDQFLLWTAGIFGGLFVVKNLLLFALIHLINFVIRRKMAVFVQSMFHGYLGRSFSFHLTRNSSELLRNLTVGAGRAFECFRIIMMIALEGFLVVAAFGLLLAVEPLITLSAMAVLSVFGMVYYYFSSPMFRHWGSQMQDLDTNIIRSISEALGSIKDIKVMHCHDYVEKGFRHHTNRFAHFLTLSASAQHIPRLSIETIVIIGFVITIVFLSGQNVPSSETISTLGLFGMAALRLMPSMNRILSSLSDLKHRAATVEALYADVKSGQMDTHDLIPENNDPLPSLSNNLTLTDLTFQYESAHFPAIGNLNLVIKKGESIGIVGASGAGKTTLLNILLGLLRPSSGQLTMDGRDVFSNVGSWQRHLGYVPQEIFLIDDTLRRNIAFGIEDDAISEGRISAVAAMTRLEAIIEELPRGLDTVLGEKGARLSGGQKQRVAIARALYRDPDILLFDEATAALDNETEYEITAALDTLSGQKTIIVIAHRLSTIRHSDRIIFMKNGHIVDQGSFDYLVQSNAEFRQLAELGNLTLS